MGQVSVILLKVIFLFCVVCQTVLWPSVASIVFCVLHGLWGVAHYVSSDSAKRMQYLAEPGVFLLSPNGKTKASYTHMALMLGYFFIYFAFFPDESLRLLPSMTPFLDASLLGRYRFEPEKVLPLPVDVTSNVSTHMRSETFVWERSFQKAPPAVRGIVPGIGASGQDVTCGAANSAFDCYAKFVRQSDGKLIPLPSQLYATSLLVQPPSSGTACKDLEVYRVVLDGSLAVVSPLDYPSSVSSSVGSRVNLATGLFGVENWSLNQKHTFTHAAYKESLGKVCSEYGGNLLLHLPHRFDEVDGDSGRMSVDLFLVTAGAKVTLRADWVDRGGLQWYLSPFKRLATDDALNDFRRSNNDVVVFLKFVVSTVPFLLTWYYLAYYFNAAQIPLLNVFVLVPSILLFLSVGAYLPLAGSLITAMAVHYPVSGKAAWSRSVRPILLFLTAVCNSVQFAWLVALISSAGWTAFYYQDTIAQLYELAFRFVVTDSTPPMWIGLVLPSVLLTNLFFLLGSTLCVVYETVLGHSV
jgi:hypothetical protein